MTSPTRSHPALAASLLALAVVLALASLCLTWVGFTESDDVFYAQAAMGWVRQPPFLGDSHWALRHCIVLPMAVLFRLFGQSEAMLVLPSLLYAAGLLALLAHIAWRLHGWLASAFTIAIAGTIPVIATGASLVSTDLPEAFFVIASLWVFHRGLPGPRAAMLLWSGGLAGFAVITRETAVALLVLYAILFAIGYGGRRRAYPWLALGVAIVVGLDWLYLTSLSGDPLYRWHIALAGVRGDGPQMAGAFATAPGLDRFGAVDVPRWLKPFAATFANQSFGLFPWLAVPATIWVITGGPARARPGSALIGALALTWFVVLGFLLMPWLWVIPRYYAVCTVLAVPLAIALAQAARVGRRWIAGAALALVIGSGTALNLGATTDQMAGERALAGFAPDTPEIIHTDPATEQGARWLLERQGAGDRVSAGLPQAGSLYFYNSRPRRALPADWPIRAPPPDWVRVKGFDVPPRWTRILVTAFGLGRVLPAGLIGKLDPPPHVIGIYRVPAS